MVKLKTYFLFVSVVFALSIFFDSVIDPPRHFPSLRELLILKRLFNGKKVNIFPPKHLEQVKVCSSKYTWKGDTLQDEPDTKNDVIPTIYFVTPTYPRREQMAELTRLAQTLLHIKNLRWVVAEDSIYFSKMLNSLLERFGIPYTHLSSPMPNIYKHLSMQDRPRGVSGRRAGIQWVLTNHLYLTALNHNKLQLTQTSNASGNKSDVSSSKYSSVIYFGDDDNT